MMFSSNISIIVSIYPSPSQDVTQGQFLVECCWFESRGFLLLSWWPCCILTFDSAKHVIPKWCTGRKWHIPMASNRKKSRRRILLTKWDKVKAHDTLIDWCTGREWPLNCMTVISAWWRSNMPFQRLSGRLRGRLNYYITRWEQEVRWVGDQMS